MGLLSELIVQGSRAGSTAGSAGGGIGRLIGGIFGGGGGRGLPAPPPAVFGTPPPAPAGNQDAGQRIRDLYTGTTVDPVDVVGTAPALDPGSAAGQALASIAAGAGSGGRAANTNTPDQATPDQTQQDPTEVAPLDVVANIPPRTPQPVVNFPTDLLTQQPSISLPAQPDDGEPLQEAKDGSDLLLPAAALGVAGLGLALPSGAGVSATGGGLPFGLTPADLIAAGGLGTALLTGNNGLGGAGKGLEDIAANNKALGDRLGNIADAGFQGNIGGKGLNSIDRMVRKAQAAIRQRYAGMGMSGSTAERDDLNDAVEAGVQQQFEIGQKMAATGLNAIAALTGQSAQAYLALLNAQTAKDTALGNSIANFVAQLAH